MNLLEINDFIDLVTKKQRGGFNSYAEKDSALDRASLFLFEEYKPMYAKSIEAKEALAPFRKKYHFTSTSLGVVSVPDSEKMVHLLSMEVLVTDAEAVSAGFTSPRVWPVRFPNEDEMQDAKNSQLNQPTSTDPIADITGVNAYEISPTQTHTGNIYFLKRPDAPFLSHTIVNRVFTYDSVLSVQLEWTEPYINQVIFKALEILDINLGGSDIAQYSAQLAAKQ